MWENTPNTLRITVRCRASPSITCVNRLYKYVIISQRAVRNSENLT